MSVVKTGQVGRKIRDEAFANRLNSAVTAHPLSPRAYGRMSWLMHQLHENFQEDVSLETVRKWFAGEMRPRPDKMNKVARILEVHEGWLSLGITADLKPRERRARNATADGAVNLVAGLIQMAGGHPAFPDDNDRRAEQDRVDLYAIIKGANFAIHVAYCADHGSCRFTVPNSYANITVVGVVRSGPLTFDCYELETAFIEASGVRKGGGIDLDVSADDLKNMRITSFGERNFGR